MLKKIYNNESFIINKKNKKFNNNLIFEKNLTPIKLIYNDNINYTTNIQKSKILNQLYLKDNKNDINNIKLKLLNHSKNNSRNFSSSNGLNTNSINTKPNFLSLHTNNSLSFATNYKTTFDSNFTKTQYKNTIIK